MKSKNENEIILDSKRSKLRRQRNGVSRGSVSAPLLLVNIYRCDLPSTIFCSRIRIVALILRLKRLGSQDMTTVSAYLNLNLYRLLTFRPHFCGIA